MRRPVSKHFVVALRDGIAALPLHKAPGQRPSSSSGRAANGNEIGNGKKVVGRIYPLPTLLQLIKRRNLGPGFFGGFDKLEQVQILWADHAFQHQFFKIDHTFPE